MRLKIIYLLFLLIPIVNHSCVTCSVSGAEVNSDYTFVKLADLGLSIDVFNLAALVARLLRPI